MEKVRIGVVGLGGRGNHHATLTASFDNAEITAVCDLYQDRVDSVSQNVENICGKRPTGYLDYKEMFEKEDLDGVIIATSWTTHTRIAVAAMRAINALSLANFLFASRKVSFDVVVETMYQTGKDLSHLYRETSEGGLAKLYTNKS